MSKHQRLNNLQNLVFSLYADGNSIDYIAGKTNLSIHTINIILHSSMEALESGSLVEAVVVYTRSLEK